MLLKAMMTQNQQIQNLPKTKPKTNIRDYAVKSDDDPKPTIQNLRKTKPKTNIRDYAVKSDDDPKPKDPISWPML